MTAHSGVPTVLIVDHDVGLVCWLGEVFTEIGLQAIPAVNCRQALAFSDQLAADVDVVAVNPGLPGVSRMIQTLKSAQPNLKVILIQDHDDEPNRAPPADATIERPSGWQTISRTLWHQKLRGVLRLLNTNPPPGEGTPARI